MKFRFLRHLLPKNVRRAIGDRRDELEERRLYRQFMAKGDLVFDLGANLGRKTKAFLALGANVVAVEPNPDCEDIIHRRCRSAVDRVYCASCPAPQGPDPGASPSPSIRSIVCVFGLRALYGSVRRRRSHLA